MSLSLFKRKNKADDASSDNSGAENVEGKSSDNTNIEPAQTSVENADTPENNGAKPGIGKKILKAALLVMLLVVLGIIGFIVGVYMRIIDGNAASEQVKKHDVPILGEYLAKIPLSPESKDEPAPAEGDAAKKPDSKAADDSAKKAEDDKTANKKADKDKDKDAKKSKTIKLTKEEIERQTKERETAEKKRVSKLARLYTNMKAKEAADALVNLDNNMIIAILQRMEEGQAAKILAQFEPERTAQITRIMFVGAQQRVTVPADVTENGEETPAEQ